MPYFFHLIFLLFPCPALLTHDAALLSMSHRISRDTKAQPIKVLISEPCLQGSQPCEPSEAKGKEVELEPGAPLVLTHRIRLVQGSGEGCGGCEADFAALRSRIERLEREVSALREKCGDPEGGCCTSQQSKGVGCTTVRPPIECPDDCSDQGRCVDGKCECFPGFSGPDCSESNCPGNCNNKGRCVNAQCICDPGFTDLDCSQVACPGNCNNRGRCVTGQCVCNPGFTGPDCSTKACPKNCSNRGRCVNGKCVCNSTFTGPDCSIRACPGNCSNKGRCVNGRCVCEAGFSGLDCSQRSCPGNCKNKGRCVNGLCVCNAGFSGPDCSIKTCPANCSNQGKCVNGKCVCDISFTGPDCSERTCPGNCNNKGRCVDGECVCEPEFSGPDCSIKTCPANCNNHGKCLNGKCVCDPGFTGPDCSAKSCPNNCSEQGQCVDGQCVCKVGFIGLDCSAKSCPNNCSNKGRCVNGKCVCNVGFTGQDCSTKACPNNCSKHGRCVKGRCVCLHGFALPDCSQCEDGLTGPDCTTALTGVTHLSTRDITESSVTLFWTPPSVQYDTYHITFTSKKESDQKITSKVSGRLTTYTQVGLAAGQQYTVIIVGEKDGKMGAESATEFQTLISGPKDLQVVKRSTSSVIVQWERALGEIDRYILFVSPNQTDGSGGGSQEIKLPPERDSAQIDGLVPGLLYDISLVAEKDGAESSPATVQATPETTKKTSPRLTVETVAMQTSLRNYSSDSRTGETEPDISERLEDKEEKTPFGAQKPGTFRDISAPKVNISARPGLRIFSRPGQSRPAFKEKALLRPGSRPAKINGPNIGMLRFNSTRTGVRGGRVGPYPLKKPTGRFPAEGPRAKKPVIGSGLQQTNPKDSAQAQTSQKIDSTEPMEGSHSGVKNGTEGSFSQSTISGTENNLFKDQNMSITSEEPLEPTVTTEKNLTVHINGTKCVRKVLVGHRKIHFSGTSNGKVSAKNMTVIVGHINGEDILHKILLGTSEGLADGVTPLKENGAKLPGDITEQKPIVGNERQEDREAGEGGMKAAILNVPLLQTETLTEKLRVNTQDEHLRLSTQNEEDGKSLSIGSTFSTSPPAPLAIPLSQPALFSSETQTRPTDTNPLLTERHTTRTPPKMPPPHRYQTYPKSTGSTTTGIKGGPISSVSSSWISKDRHPTRNSHSVSSLDPSLQKQETSEKDLTGSQGHMPDRQGLHTFQGHRVVPSLNKLPLKDLSTDAKKNGNGGMLEHEQPKVRNGTSMPFRRTPFRGTFLRKPNIGPFQNRTRLFLKPPQQPYRPALPKVSNRNNSTVRLPTALHQAKPEINSSSQDELLPKPRFTVRRKNGTIIRSNFHRQVRTNATTIPRRAQDNFETTGKDSKVILPSGKHISKESETGHQANEDQIKDSKVNFITDDPTVTSTQDKSYSEDRHKDTLPRITNRYKVNPGQSLFKDQMTPGTIRRWQNGSNPNLGPSLAIRRKNGTVFRPSPKYPLVKPKGTIIQGDPNSRGVSTTNVLKAKDKSKDPKLGLSPDKDKSKEFEAAPSTVMTAGGPQETFSFAEGSEDGINHVGVQNVTSKGFVVIWGAPKDRFKYFVIRVEERGRPRAGQPQQGIEEEDKREQSGPTEMGQEKGDERKEQNSISEGRENVHGNAPDSHSSIRNSSDGGAIKKFTTMLPGSARSYPVTDLAPQTGYSVSLFGNGPGLRSNIYNIVIRTGPEPPSNLVFREVSESSLTVSWTRPKSPVSGFKVTYTHKEDGEPISVTVDSTDSSLALSKLSPGSSYEVGVISLLGLDESDPVNGIVLTLPDPPTDLRAINITDTKALLLWRPALATVDQYVIVYGSEEVPGTETIRVSGNAAEQQLQALRASTKYSVTIFSQLGDGKSLGTTTIFSTTSGSGGIGEGPRDLTASQVTPHTAMLSWKPPASAVRSYKLIYLTDGQEIKEVTLDPNITEYKLTGLHPSSTYTARLQAQRGGLYTAAISTQFTTGSLRFPFPTDCSQELLNGVRESGVREIFPGGKNSQPVRVYCDMETDGGGWTVFQRRKDGKVNFFRGWQEYSRGFGELDGEFWLGNELLHNLTTRTPMALRVDLKTGEESVHALYPTFSVDTMKKHYMIRVSGYSGTAGDSLKYHDRRPFSTHDRDPQPFITRCAMSYRGGWWYRNCHEANLNGLYDTHTNHQGVIWTAWKGKDFSIPFAEMKLRPTSFDPRTQG